MLLLLNAESCSLRSAVSVCKRSTCFCKELLCRRSVSKRRRAGRGRCSMASARKLRKDSSTKASQSLEKYTCIWQYHISAACFAGKSHTSSPAAAYLKAWVLCRFFYVWEGKPLHPVWRFCALQQALSVLRKEILYNGQLSCLNSFDYVGSQYRHLESQDLNRASSVLAAVTLLAACLPLAF